MDNPKLLNLNANIVSERDAADERYVIFNLAQGTFAVNCKYVISIEKPTKITKMANSPMGVRGVGYYKDEAINIFDLRIIFGYPSHEYHVEHEINIGGHIMEHEGWAAEMKESVDGGSAFSTDFKTDPLSCNLGKWLEGYKTNDMNTENMIKRIKLIHEKFHKYADKISDLNSENQEKVDTFFEEMDAVKDEFTRNLNELHDMLLKQSKENTIILRVNGKKIGIIIDNAESVETMTDIQILPPAALVTQYITRLGFRPKAKQAAAAIKKDPQPTLILEAEMFV